ncbi:uncharacterized protein LOC124308221 [Neodiprion virginianus]|uniref:uncharacterized protein LOC124308221 n=1 Tax=Neodiprion virginianus TaxID=2961670 RepID=UPI001EE6E7E8|nr:uncharacterized protein LOC124308221 [Neodiprion virginianus]
MAEQRKAGECFCSRRKKGTGGNKPKPSSKRKRQTLVHNPDEEIWHEPYMHCLRKEFSQKSIPCDSKIELPWRDIALPPVAMRIRPNVTVKEEPVEEAAQLQEIGGEDSEGVDSKESTGKMKLPWKDLLVMDTVAPQPRLRADGALCDSTLEIPWEDLAFERPVEIRPIPEEELCDLDDVEIPWEDILLPANIVIEARKKKHPSSRGPPNYLSARGGACCGDNPCCTKARRK